MEIARTVQSIFRDGSSTTTTERFTHAMAEILKTLAKTAAAMPQEEP